MDQQNFHEIIQENNKITNGNNKNENPSKKEQFESVLI